MQQHDSRAAAPDLDRTAFPQDRQRLFHAVLGKARRYGKAAPAGCLSPLLALAQRFQNDLLILKRTRTGWDDLAKRGRDIRT